MRASLKHIRLLALDLDGTLLNAQGVMSASDRNTLEKLQQQGVTLVCATGRSLLAMKQVLQESDPFHYAIFSTGAGIVHWPSKHPIRTITITPAVALQACEILCRCGASFMAHAPIPHNHRFYFYEGLQPHLSDFHTRLTKLQAHATPLPPLPLTEALFPHGISQLLITMPYQPKWARSIIHKLPPQLEAVWVTSPIDYRSLWLEIFPTGVNKGAAIAHLCDTLQIPLSHTAAVGNDYNDMAMLNTVGHPFVVANAPRVLRTQFPRLPAHTESPITHLGALGLLHSPLA